MFQAGVGQIHQATGTTFIRVCLQTTNKKSNVRIFSRNPTGYVWRLATYIWAIYKAPGWLGYICGWHPTQLCLGLFLKPWNIRIPIMRIPSIRILINHEIRIPVFNPPGWLMESVRYSLGPLESSAPEENMEESAGATLDAYTHTRAAVSQPRKCFFLKNLFWGWQNDIAVTQNRKN